MSSDIALVMPSEGDFHKFQFWFAAAWKDSGAAVVRDVKIPHKIRALMGRVVGCSLWRYRRKIMILGCHRIESMAWPWCWRYEIVPMMWDLWPENFGYFSRFLKRNRVNLCFVTASRNVAKIHEACPDVKVVWVPEGISAAAYPVGGRLAARTIDVLNYGRQVSWINEAIESYNFGRAINHMYQRGPEFLFKDFDSLAAGIRDAKMAICYPQCDTNPQRCGDVETLTQRYWECMLSGTLMIGRAPQELIDLCGYNPVITLGEQPARQIEDVLNHIEDYQELADRNRAYAEKNADWSTRIPIIMDALKG
jgi:hypothetical protein